MFNAVKLFVLFVVATVFHWAFASLFVRWGISVNVMLVFVTAFCSLLKSPVAYSAAFLCGLFLDFFGTKLFGNNAFTFTICACIVCNTVDRFDFEELFPQMVAAFVFTWLAGIANTVLVLMFAHSNLWPGFWNLLVGATLNALCAPLIFWLVRWIMGSSSLSRQG